MRPRLTPILSAVLFTALATAAAAQPSIRVEPIECLPHSEHGTVRAEVRNQPPSSEVRVYFRRLHEVVEDFYYVQMEAEAPGRYWAALPKPAEEENERYDLEERLRQNEDQDNHPWAAWWKMKEASEDRNPNEELDQEEIDEKADVGEEVRRDWMDARSLEELEEWLEEQEYEPAEYYGAVVDADGTVLAVSPMLVTEVLEPNDCEVELTEKEEGFAFNLTVGETAPWQANNQRVFHWLCDHVVTRIDWRGIRRADEVCRACVIVWWKKKEFLIPAASGAGLITGILVDDQPPPVSPILP